MSVATASELISISSGDGISTKYTVTVYKLWCYSRKNTHDLESGQN